jgi:hypothetical protein
MSDSQNKTSIKMTRFAAEILENQDVAIKICTPAESPL